MEVELILVIIWDKTRDNILAEHPKHVYWPNLIANELTVLFIGTSRSESGNNYCNLVSGFTAKTVLPITCASRICPQRC